jgi:hypothetical protein
VFSVCIIIFSCFHFYFEELLGIDSWYHIKITQIYTEQGFFTEFPWMQFSPIKEHYADRWLSFHMSLLPFVFGDLILGAKLAAIFQSSFLFLVFYLVMKKLEVEKPVFWTLLLFSSQNFIFRLALLRAFVMASFLFLISIYMMQKRNYKGLLIASFLFVSTYSLFPLLFLFIVVFALVDYFHEKKFDKKMIYYSLIGILLGLILNPYFPYNIFYNVHEMSTMSFWFTNKEIVQDISSIFPNEVLSTSLGPGFINTSYFVLLFLCLGSVHYILFDKKTTLKTTLVVVIFLFSILYLNGQRFLEYWVPFGILTSSVLLSGIIKKFEFEGLKFNVGKFKISEVNIFFSVIFLVLLIITMNNWTEFRFYTGNAIIWGNYLDYKDCADWLGENTESGSVVFTFWDEFTFYFHYNTNNYYILGINPLDLYIYNETLFEAYLDVFEWEATGRDQIIINNFNPDYIATSERSVWYPSKTSISNNNELLYNNTVCSIFKV